MKRLVLFAVLLLAALASGYQLFSTEARYKHAVQAKLDEFAQAVEVQDPAKVKALLAAGIDDFAHIGLEVQFPVPGQAQTHPPAELFGKTEFLTFVDNMLYSVNSYHFKAKVGDLELSRGNEFGILAFTAQMSAHGASSVLMEAGSEFSASAKCQTKVLFDPRGTPTLGDLNCVIMVGR